MNWWKRFTRWVEQGRWEAWRRVPPPNYNCSRGKQTDCKYGDYW